MGSIDREDIVADYAAVSDAVSRILGHSYDGLTTQERLTYLESLEREMRRLPAACHELINQIEGQATPTELGGTFAHVLADRLRITRGEANRSITDARALGTRRALTGEPLAPRYAATAAAQRGGHIGASDIAVIHRFFDELPSWVDAPTRDAAEADLARWAGHQRPEGLRKVADRITCYLNPDGQFTDHDRARRRGLTLGTQDCDGMSKLSGWLTPEARATWEAVLAKLAAPGMCNPDDEALVVDGAPSEEALQRDTRSPAQRNHDGLNAALRAMLASGELGQHNGMPATIVVTTALKDLEAAAGTGLTGGGTVLPMSDMIRLARHAHHYLAVFDKGNAVAPYHRKRLASPGQRIVLHAKDRGCSAPGCDVAGYYREVHHVQDWASTYRTDIDQLTLACGPHHRLLEKGWTTRRRANGDIEWIPPPHQDRGQPRTNTFHHPEKTIAQDDEDDDPP